MPRRPLTLDDILALGVRNEEGCLLWPKPTSRGYARIVVDGMYRPLHRYVWILSRGPIPDGLTVDHLCHNEALRVGTCSLGVCRHRACYEITHLDLKTIGENVAAAFAAAPNNQRSKTHCPEGHPYSGENLITSSGARRCRECRNRNERAGWARRKLHSDLR